MRRKQMKKYHLRVRTITKNSEGGDDVGYAAAVPIEATIWAAGGAVQAAQYGEKLTYIKNMEYSGKEALKEGDGICVYVAGDEDPDYKIISINRDVDPNVITLEKING